MVKWTPIMVKIQVAKLRAMVHFLLGRLATSRDSSSWNANNRSSTMGNG